MARVPPCMDLKHCANSRYSGVGGPAILYLGGRRGTGVVI